MSDQEEFDLEKFADLFDTAMTSTNPAVQRAFKNLLMIAALVDGNTAPTVPGPLRKLVEEVRAVRRQVEELEYSKSTYTKTYTPNPYTTNTPGTGSPWTTGVGSQFPPGTIIGGMGTSTSTTIADIDKAKYILQENMRGSNFNALLSKWESKYD